MMAMGYYALMLYYGICRRMTLSLSTCYYGRRGKNARSINFSGTLNGLLACGVAVPGMVARKGKHCFPTGK